MKYRVIVEPAALRSLRKLDSKILERIEVAVNDLAENPRPHGCVKLTARALWRVRVGDWRIIYEIHDKEIIVLVVRVGHRRDVYE